MSIKNSSPVTWEIWKYFISISGFKKSILFPSYIFIALILLFSVKGLIMELQL